LNLSDGYMILAFATWKDYFNFEQLKQINQLLCAWENKTNVNKLLKFLYYFLSFFRKNIGPKQILKDELTISLNTHAFKSLGIQLEQSSS